MKKSNKVLLIAFFTFLFIISAVHISLNARYKSGRYTEMATERQGIQDNFFAGVQHVVLKDLGNVNLTIDDTASVGKRSKDDQDYTVTQQGNILYITGKDFPGHQTRSRTAIWVTVPSGGSVTATNVLMDTEQFKPTPGGSLNFTLNKTRLHIRQYNKHLSFDSLSVTAMDSSYVELNNVDARTLNLQLQRSSVEESDNTFGSVQLAADSTSKVSLSTPHLIKAKISSLNHE